MSDTDFMPRWASPPGDTIRNALEEQHLDEQSLAATLDFADEEFEAFLAGEIPLTIRRAELLSSAIGGSIGFWMARDGQYREDRSRVIADAWAQQMPIKDMRKFGWIAADADDWIGQIDACLRFFGVTTPEAWETGHKALVKQTRFRSSQTYSADEFAVATWLRQCEVELSKVPCREWDREAFAALLPQLLPLTRERDPRRFVPALQAQCAEAGVAVGIVPAPHGCPVSGAARQLDSGRPSIALSARHRADDHLWFTFFHEAAHLVLHRSDALYVDVLEHDSGPTSAEEAEADEFAGSLLVPTEFRDRLARAKQSPRELKSIADEIGVGLGIVVGQLQHRGLVGYNTKLNRLKNRYVWSGTNLEKA